MSFCKYWQGILIVPLVGAFNQNCPYRLADIVDGFGESRKCACVNPTALACRYLNHTSSRNNYQVLATLVFRELEQKPWLQASPTANVIHVRAGDGIVGPNCFYDRRDCLWTAGGGHYGMSKEGFDKMALVDYRGAGTYVCVIHVSTEHSTHHPQNKDHQRQYMNNVIRYFEGRCASVIVKANIDPDDAFVSMASASHLFLTGGQYGVLAKRVGQMLHKGGVKAAPRNTNRYHSTVVTAYFPVPSKHSVIEYESWMRNFFTLRDAMIIFTTPSLVHKITQFRSHLKRRTEVIATTLNDCMSSIEFNDTFWARQHDLDPEKNLHTINLYKIWTEKANFVKRAIDLNPFDSEFFAWVDVGYFRTPNYNGKELLHNIPPLLGQNQVLMLNVTSLDRYKYMGGGFIGGYKTGIARWNQKYYDMIRLHQHEFIGKEQPWMHATCEKTDGLCYVVDPTNKYGDPWFYMAPYLIYDLASRHN